MKSTCKPDHSTSTYSYRRLSTALSISICVATSMAGSMAGTTGAAHEGAAGVAIEFPQRSLCTSTPTSYTVILDSPWSVAGFSLGFSWDPEKVRVLEINPGKDVPDLLFQDTKIEEDGLGRGQAFVAMVATPGSAIGVGTGSEILEIMMAWNSSRTGGDAAEICLVESFGDGTSVRRSVVSVLEADGAFSSVAPAEVCGSITPVEDTVPPHIHCPNDIVVDCAPHGTEVDFQVGVSDNCGDYSFECVPPPGSVFPPGTTEVLVTATDLAGNTSVCSFEVTVGTEACFRRGDTNSDTLVDVTDPINLLQNLFLGLGAVDCPDAADVNDDGLLELVDAIILLYHLYLGGDPPAPPGKEHCGVDPNKDELDPCVYSGECAHDDCVDEDGDGECDCVDVDLDGICDETGVPHGGGGGGDDGGGGGGDGPHHLGEWELLECETEGEGCLEHPMVHAVLMKNDTIAFCGSGAHDTWEYESQLVEHMHFPLYPLDTLFCSGHVNLADGKVLWVGGTTHEHDHGQPFQHYVGSKTVYTFDPDAIDPWQEAGEMADNRWYPTVTTLNDGKVFATGGWIEANINAKANNVPEIYDPESGSWKLLPNAEKYVSGYPFMFLLPDPNAPKLFYAGRQECGGERTFILELTDDPYEKTEEVAWGPEIATDPDMVFDCEDPNIEPVGLAGGSAVMYRPGLIMKAGGPEMCQCVDADDNGELDVEDATKRTVVVDARGACPAQCPLWREDAAMNYARYDFNLTILPTGDVLAVGGSELAHEHDDDDADPNSSDAVKAAELWTPPEMQGVDQGTWSVMAEMKYPRKYHSVAVLLPDARVLAGGACRPKKVCPPPEIFSPPYLFDENDDPAVQPVIDSVSTLEPDYGEVFQMEVSETTSQIDKIVLIRPASVTHGFDMEQKYVELDFDTTECNNNEICSKFVVMAPAHGYLAPPGYYMLFVINQDGVPSKAAKIRLPIP